MNIETLKKEIEKNVNALGKTININDYNWMNESPDLHTPVMICLGGSHAYGTNIEGSDMDIRGIAMHSKRDILLHRGFEQICDENTDTTIYSLEKIVNLMTNCNPNTIEILGVRPDHILYCNYIGKELIKNKDMFLSKKCIGPFMGYANQQLYRLQQKALVALSEEEFNAHIYRSMQNMRDSLYNQYPECMDGLTLKLDKEKGILMTLDMKDIPIDRTENLIENFTKCWKDYHKTSQRNEKALAHGKIAKHSMHLLRLYMMCEDILLHGEINTYREKEHDLLMSIRNGEWLEADGKPNKEFFKLVDEYNERVQKALTISKLPEKPDFKRIDDFVYKANEYMMEEN